MAWTQEGTCVIFRKCAAHGQVLSPLQPQLFHLQNWEGKQGLLESLFQSMGLWICDHSGCLGWLQRRASYLQEVCRWRKLLSGAPGLDMNEKPQEQAALGLVSWSLPPSLPPWFYASVIHTVLFSVNTLHLFCSLIISFYMWLWPWLSWLPPQEITDKPSPYLVVAEKEHLMCSIIFLYQIVTIIHPWATDNLGCWTQTTSNGHLTVLVTNTHAFITELEIWVPTTCQTLG